MSGWRASKGICAAVLVGAAGVMIVAPTAAAQKTAFVSALDDVPLPATFSETGEAVVFETIAGRILQIEAIGVGDRAGVREYYALSLPQLGWRQEEDAFAFIRGGERLEIDVTPAENGSRIAFRLIAEAPSMSLADTPPGPDNN